MILKLAIFPASKLPNLSSHPSCFAPEIVYPYSEQI